MTQRQKDIKRVKTILLIVGLALAILLVGETP